MKKSTRNRQGIGVKALTLVQKFFPEVEEVIDATEAVTLEVTKRDCSSATVRNHNACALAVAAKRAFKATGVIVGVRTVYLIDDTVAQRFTINEHVAREIVAFDRNGEFEAGEYLLQAPDKYRKLGHGYSTNDRRAHAKTKPQMKRATTKGIRMILGSKFAA